MVDFPHFLEILDNSNDKRHDDNKRCIFSRAIGYTRFRLVKSNIFFIIKKYAN